MSRLEPLVPERMSPEQRDAKRALVEARSRVPDTRPEGVYEPPDWSDDRPLGGPFDPWLRSPELARRLVALGGVLRFGTSLPARLTELAILLVGRRWTAQFEWYAHEPMARRAGVPPEAIDAIREGRPPPLEAEDERAVHAFAVELLERKRVSDAAYARLVEAVGEPGAVELVALLGYYTLVSMTLNVFEVPIPPDATPLPEPD